MHNFQGHYNGWREARIRKIEKIFGTGFFNNKNILEVGAGYGDIGNHFIDLGAKVTFTEGRQENFNVLNKRFPYNKCHLIDHEKQWDLSEKFDLIIHFGLLYHLINWRQDLLCTFKHSDLIIMESEVSSSNEDHEYFYEEHGYDQAINEEGKGCRASAKLIETFVKENGFDFVRYDDSDLNHGLHTYDWKETDSNKKYDRDTDIGKRRFWILRKK